MAYYGEKKLIFAIEISYNDCTKRIVSDKTSFVRETNGSCGLYVGNRVDFSENEKLFTAARESTCPNGDYINSDCPDDRIHKILKPLKIERRKERIFVDFGENHSGGVYFRIKGKKGQKIIIGHAETLYKNGELNYETSRYEEYSSESGKLLRRIDQKSEYVLSGNEDIISPSFNWFCYRFVEISGCEDAEISDLKSLFIYADVDSNGEEIY